jgi:hypothetical protein
MYRITAFGSVSLQHYNQVDTIGSGATPTAFQTLPEGGALDLYGSQQKHPGAVERSVTRRLKASTQASLESLFFQLLAMRGRRERLYRETATGDIHWQYARLVEVIADRNYEQTKFKSIQDISLRFITQEAFWRGDLGGVWYFDSGEYFDTGLAFDSGQTYLLASSPTNITVSVGLDTDAGRAPIRALRMRATAGSSAITSITIARTGGESLTFGASIVSGDQLIIDTGTMQVTNNGIDAYDDLTISPTADMAVWFSLQPGDNPLTVTFTGGGTGSSIDFYYYEVWY